MNIPTPTRPLSGRRRKPIDHSQQQHQKPRRSLHDELDEIPSAEELEAQMKLFGRLQDHHHGNNNNQQQRRSQDNDEDQVFHEWLALGQPSTIEQDLEVEAATKRKKELEFVARYEQLFGDSRARMALLPSDIIAELMEMEEEEQQKLLIEQHGGDDDDADDSQLHQNHLVVHPNKYRRKKKRYVPLKMIIHERDLGDGFVIDENEAGEDGPMVEIEEDDDANVANSWDAQLALRLALLRNGESIDPRSRLARLLGLATSTKQYQRGGASTVSGEGGNIEYVDARTGEQLFDDGALYGKEHGEPLFIPSEPQYVGRCAPLAAAALEDRQEQSASLDSDEEEEEEDADDDDGDDDDGDNTPDTRSLGAMALDVDKEDDAKAQKKADNDPDAPPHQKRVPLATAAQLPSVGQLASLETTDFEIKIVHMLERCRELTAELNMFVHRVEQSFWEDVAQRSLTRKAPQHNMMMRAEDNSSSCAQAEEQQGAEDDDDLFTPGRGSPETAISRVRTFLERALFQLDAVLSEELPDADHVLPAGETREEARRRKNVEKNKAHNVASFFGKQTSPKPSSSPVSPSSSSPASTKQASPSHALAASIVSKQTVTSTTTGAGGTSALPWEDHRYAIVLNIVTSLLDELLHKDSNIVSTTTVELQQLMDNMRQLQATSLAHVLARDEALGEAHAAIAEIHALVRIAARVAVHAEDEKTFRVVARTFVSASRRMQDFGREIARVGEIALLDATDLRQRLVAARSQHEAMVVSLLELGDAIETQPVFVPRHDQWRRRALDELFSQLNVCLSTLATLEVAADERAEKLVSSLAVADHIRKVVVVEKKSFMQLSRLYFPDEDGSVMTGVALAIAARRKLREIGRVADKDWGFSIF